MKTGWEWIGIIVAVLTVLLIDKTLQTQKGTQYQTLKYRATFPNDVTLMTDKLHFKCSLKITVILKACTNHKQCFNFSQTLLNRSKHR